MKGFQYKIPGRSLSKYKCFLHRKSSGLVVGVVVGMVVGFVLGWLVGCDVGLEATVLKNVSSLPFTLIWL